MCHKVRVALTEDIDQLAGLVEVDETFVGGLAKNRHKDKRGDGSGGPGGAAKSIIVGAVKRKGNVVARVIANVQAKTLEAFIREARPRITGFPRFKSASLFPLSINNCGSISN